MRERASVAVVLIAGLVIGGCSTMKAIGNGALVATGAACRGMAQAEQNQQQTQAKQTTQSHQQPQLPKCVCGLLATGGGRMEVTTGGIWSVYTCVGCNREVWVKR